MFCDLYSSPNVIRAIKSGRMQWAGHVWRSGDVHTGFWLGDLRERDLLKNLEIDEKQIKIDLQKMGCVGSDWTDISIS
jgi:hypothetical protein